MAHTIHTLHKNISGIAFAHMNGPLVQAHATVHAVPCGGEEAASQGGAGWLTVRFEMAAQHLSLLPRVWSGFG